MKTFCLYFFLLSTAPAFSQELRNTVFMDEREIENQSIKRNKILAAFLYGYTFKKHEIKDSFLLSRWVYMYDSADNLIQEIKFNKTNAVESKSYYVYNERKQLIKSILEWDKMKSFFGMLSISEYEYDTLGNIITEYYYNEDTTRLRVEQNLYDSQNNLVEIRTKVDNGNFFTSRKFYYDDHNQLLKEEALDENGKWTYSNVYEYDNQTHSKQYFLENHNGRKFVSQSYFNEADQLVRVGNNYEDVVFVAPWQPPAFEALPEVREFEYNPDGTLSSWTVKVKGKIAQLHRRYYQFP